MNQDLLTSTQNPTGVGRRFFRRTRFARRYLATSAMLVAFSTMQVGCVSSALTAGSNLATAGQAATAQMAQNATISNTTLANVKRAVAFTDGYNGVPGNATSAALVTQVSTLQTNLNQYGKVLNSLSSAYAALGSLSSYNGAGDFSTAVGTLDTDFNAFTKSVHSSVSVPQDVGAVVGAAGGVIITAIQAQDVKTASAKIEVVLNQLIVVLSDPVVKDNVIGAQGLLQGDMAIAGQTLFNSHVYSYGPLMNQLGAPLALTASASSDSVVNSDPHVLAGLRNVELEEINEQISSTSTSYDASLSALKALVPLHESLAKGEPLNAAALSSIVSQLQSIATTIQSSQQSTAPPAKGK